ATLVTASTPSGANNRRPSVVTLSPYIVGERQNGMRDGSMPSNPFGPPVRQHDRPAARLPALRLQRPLERLEPFAERWAVREPPFQCPAVGVMHDRHELERRVVVARLESKQILIAIEKPDH